MTREEYDLLHEGDVVQIISKRPSNVGFVNHMEHWLGCVVTIKRKESNWVRIEEDGGIWGWFYKWLEEPSSDIEVNQEDLFEVISL